MALQPQDHQRHEEAGDQTQEVVFPLIFFLFLGIMTKNKLKRTTGRLSVEIGTSTTAIGGAVSTSSIAIGPSDPESVKMFWEPLEIPHW